MGTGKSAFRFRAPESNTPVTFTSPNRMLELYAALAKQPNETGSGMLMSAVAEMKELREALM